MTDYSQPFFFAAPERPQLLDWICIPCLRVFFTTELSIEPLAINMPWWLAFIKVLYTPLHWPCQKELLPSGWFKRLALYRWSKGRVKGEGKGGDLLTCHLRSLASLRSFRFPSSAFPSSLTSLSTNRYIKPSEQSNMLFIWQSIPSFPYTHQQRSHFTAKEGKYCQSDLFKTSQQQVRWRNSYQTWGWNPYIYQWVSNQRFVHWPP